MNVYSAPSRRPAWQVQRAVVFALYLRELRTRFGDHRLGYLWVVLEPLVHIGTLLVVFGLLSARTMPNISFPVFLASGVAPWLLFSNTVTRCMVAMASNRGLMGFSPVKPIDTVITRMLVELIMFVSVAIVLAAIAWWLGFPVQIQNPLLLVFLVLSLLVFSGAIGLILAIATNRRPDVGKFVPAVMRPLYFASGIFFMLATLPGNLREWALMNPLAHWLDLIRVAIFSNYPAASGSLWVIGACTLLSSVLALMLYRIKRFDLIAS